MANIAYKNAPGPFNVYVFLDGKRAGTIVKTSGGWQYRVKGSTHLSGGDYFPTLSGCKKSLEAA